MYWKQPHIEKIYEALSAVADNRIQILPGNKAKCISTSGNKAYDIIHDLVSGSMMSNDNSAYYTDTLSYPMIAFLMVSGRINFDKSLLPYLTNIKWKDINQKFNNDYDKAVDFVLSDLESKKFPTEKIKTEINCIYSDILNLKIAQFGPKIKPPVAY
jgi:hypothetical protein